MRDTLLVIHILAAATWFGGSMTAGFLASRMRAIGHEAGSGFMAGFEKMGRLYYPPSAVVILATGIWLVIDNDAYNFEDSFVVIGVVSVILGAFLGIRIFGPLAQQARAAHEAQDETALDRTYRRFAGFGVLDIAILAFAVISMVTKLGV